MPTLLKIPQHNQSSFGRRGVVKGKHQNKKAVSPLDPTEKGAVRCENLERMAGQDL